MNILFSWTSAIDVKKGGIHRVTSVLLKTFRKQGHNCFYSYSLDNYQSFLIDGMDGVFYCPNDFYSFLETQQIDVVIDQDAIFSSKLAVIVHQYALTHKIKYLAVFHNSPFIWSIVFDRARLIEGIKVAETLKKKIQFAIMYLGFPLWKKQSDAHIKKRYHTIYSYCDKLILLSDKFIFPLCEFMGMDNMPKCIGIPNPLSFEKIESIDILKQKRKEVLIVSRLYNQEKRINLALEIWKILEDRGHKDWILRIVGDGFDEMKLHEQAKKLNLKNVVFEGCNDSLAYYKTASLFMLTSKVEGWGLTLTESQQNGVVPLAFDSYHSLHDIIVDNYNGCIIMNGNINKYADKLESLMVNTDERNRMAMNGLESCKRFTVDKVVAQWMKVIENL